MPPTSPESATGALPCGCSRNSVIASDKHEPLCIVTLARDLGNLPTLTRDHDRTRAPIPIAAVSPVGVDWTRVDVLPEDTVLSLDAIGWPGYWQRQGDNLVPLADDDVQGAVCYVGWRVDSLADTNAGVARAARVAHDALSQFESYDARPGSDRFDFTFADAQDCRTHLQNALRELRAALRITEPHAREQCGEADHER
ncbi:hypothetical protein [Actinophytocola sp.]|uniref:hypothetical protein n=1 Tax=Actinophytocola sp. TaxID=1872138 RepID=UPI002ED2DB86